jgi:hypothetical protein
VQAGSGLNAKCDTPMGTQSCGSPNHAGMWVMTDIILRIK